MGQESAYTCKLPELPPGTSNGLLHLYSTKEVRKIIRYNFSEKIFKTQYAIHTTSEKNIQNKFISQKTSQWTIPTSRNEKEQYCNCSKDIPKNHQQHISFFVHDLSCKSCVHFCQQIVLIILKYLLWCSQLEMSASCRVAEPPQTTCRSPTCRHVLEMSGMSSPHVVRFCRLDHARRHDMSCRDDVS